MKQMFEGPYRRFPAFAAAFFGGFFLLAVLAVFAAFFAGGAVFVAGFAARGF